MCFYLCLCVYILNFTSWPPEVLYISVYIVLAHYVSLYCLTIIRYTKIEVYRFFSCFFFPKSFTVTGNSAVKSV